MQTKADQGRPKHSNIRGATSISDAFGFIRLCMDRPGKKGVFLKKKNSIFFMPPLHKSKKLLLKDEVQEQTGGVKFIRRKKVLFEYTSKTLTLEKRIYMTI